MDKKSSKFLDILKQLEEKNEIPSKLTHVIRAFYNSYRATLKETYFEEIETLFLRFIELVKMQSRSPYVFPPYHKKIRKPIDYFKFGMDFLRPLVIKEKSSIKGQERLVDIQNHLKQGHNVVFLANHQTEADPQAIFLLLEDTFPSLSEEMIFVAGEMVVTDPLAIPFSMGCDLLCIYSKRYIDHPPELKLQKQLHNKKTMGLMSELLQEGGKCIYVAPSGGRDRRNAQKEIEIAPFDPKSIEMFYLMAKRSKTPTFFYPMALKTYAMLPPPEKVQLELGEMRSTNRVDIHMAIGEKIDMEHYPGSDHPDKELRRKCRSDYIWNLVKQDYHSF